ncbi:MAG: thymidylate synthase [Candidatus Daviesbacteria bacterium]
MQERNNQEVFLQPVEIKAWDLNEAWFRSLRAVIDKGYEYIIDRGSFQGTKRKELDFVRVHVLHPGTRPLAPIVPEGVPPPASDEYIEDYIKYLLTSEKAPNEEYTYGEYIEKQIFEVIRMYKEDGYNTNQACMAIGDAESIKLPDPPCLRQIDTRVRYGKLHFMVYFRSWDLWGGFPVNLGGLQRMKEFMAEEIGVEDGEIIACSKGLHLYEYSWEHAKAVLRM